MSAKLINIDRDTPMLLPCDLRSWVAENDIVHFIIEVVNMIDVSHFKINHSGSGSEQYPPGMMLSLLIYCYVNGIFSSRKIERATYRDIGVRYLTGDTHPDHDTISEFRRNNFEAVSSCFIKVLEMAKELKFLKVGMVSIDGTKIKASASKYKNVGYGRAGELMQQLDMEVAGLLQKAEEADQKGQDDYQNMPEEIARREILKEKLAEARLRMEKRAKAQADADMYEYEKKVKDRDSRKGSTKGRYIKEPSAEPKNETQENLVDGDSRLMRKNKKSEYIQGYNAQAVVDADGSQLILGSRITQCASDRNELEPNIKNLSEAASGVKYVLADSGYACETQVKALTSGTNPMDVYVATGAESRIYERKHDFRPKEQLSRKNITPGKTWLKTMKKKMETEKARQLYRYRKQTVEPVFGIIKHVMGFRQFLLRGLKKVTGEWNLVTLAYNFKRLWNLQIA